MAAPKSKGLSRTFWQVLIDMLNVAVDTGVITTGGTVSTALTNIATERDST